MEQNKYFCIKKQTYNEKEEKGPGNTFSHDHMQKSFGQETKTKKTKKDKMQRQRKTRNKDKNDLERQDAKTKKDKIQRQKRQRVQRDREDNVCWNFSLDPSRLI